MSTCQSSKDEIDEIMKCAVEQLARRFPTSDWVGLSVSTDRDPPDAGGYVLPSETVRDSIRQWTTVASSMPQPDWATSIQQEHGVNSDVVSG